MSFFSWLKAEEQRVQSFLSKVFGSQAVSKFEAQAEAVFQADVLKIFTDAVTAVSGLTISGQPATGAQKRDAAFSAITADLKAIGKTLENNVINFGIEYVVGLMKSGS